MLPPAPSIASAICSAVREPAPLVSSAASMEGSPSLPSGAYELPASNAMFIETTGWSWLSTTTSLTPLESVASWNGGNSAGSIGAGGGGEVGYSPVSACAAACTAACGCAAASGVAAAAAGDGASGACCWLDDAHPPSRKAATA